MSIALDMHDALTDLARVFSDPWVARQVGQAMTCDEADILAEAIALIDKSKARNFLRGHANGEDRGDNPSDQHYHLRDDYDPGRHYYCGDEDTCLGCGKPDDAPEHLVWEGDEPAGTVTGLPLHCTTPPEDQA